MNHPPSSPGFSRSRREVLRASLILGTATTLGIPTARTGNPLPEAYDGKIMTVNGPIEPGELGFCLPHEHILSRFGSEPTEPPAFDREAARAAAVPYLQYLRELGIGAVADCTAYSFGRDPELLGQLSRESGLHILTNTGFYGAADDRYVPERAFDLPAPSIAALWIDELADGIGQSGRRPGFVKTAVDSGSLSGIDAKLVRAAALVHKATGLTLAVHTGNNLEAAEMQLAILAEEGVSPRAWTWTHAQAVPEAGPLIAAAERGAWISLDGIKTPYYLAGKLQGSNTLDRHLHHLSALRRANLLDRVLLSHDGSTFPPDLDQRRPMDILSNTFIPLLRAGGYSEDEIFQLTVSNPAEYFTIARRLV